MVRITRIASLSQPMTELIGTSVAMLILWIGAREVLLGDRHDGQRDADHLHDHGDAPAAAAEAALAGADDGAAVVRVGGAALRGARPADRDAARPAARATVGELRESLAFEQRVASPTTTSPCCATSASRRGAARSSRSSARAGRGRARSSTSFRASTSRRPVASCSMAWTRARSRSPSLRGLTGIVSQDTVLFNDTVRNNIAYGAAERFTDAQIEAAARAANAHALHHRAAGGLRHGARRARHAALRRPAPAPRHRARAAHRSAHPHPRRGHVRARHRVGAARAGSDRPAARRPHGVRHRAPPLHRRARRPDPRPRPRRDRRARHARRAARAARAPTTGCTPRSSARRRRAA